MNEPPRQLPFCVERDDLHQRHPDPVGQAAVHLTLDDHRVDPHPAVVHRDEPAHLDHAGAGVDVGHADVGAERERQVRRVVDGLGVQVALHALGQLQRAVRRHRDLGRSRPTARGRRAPASAPSHPVQVVGRHLQHGRRHEPGPLPDLARHHDRRRAGDRRRPGAVGAQAERGRGRCRRARPRRRPGTGPAPAPRSGRTSSRGPGPGSAPRWPARPCRSGRCAGRRRRPCPGRGCPCAPAARRRRPR